MSEPLDPRSCKFTFECERQWKDLRPLRGQKGVRHCDSCNQSVYKVETREEWDDAMALGRCVCVVLDWGEHTTDMTVTMGVPAPWVERLLSRPRVILPIERRTPPPPPSNGPEEE